MIDELDYDSSLQVTVEMFSVGIDEWNAVAMHRRVPGLRCAIAIGRDMALAGEPVRNGR